MTGTYFFTQLTSVAIWARAFRLQILRLSSGPCYTTDLFMKSFPMKIPLVFKRPAAANANVRKRPAHFDAALQAEGTAKRPAHAVHYTEVQQRIVNEVTEWKNGHEGCMPSQYSEDPTERKVYTAFKKLPAEIKNHLLSTAKENRWRLVIQKYLDFTEEHGYLPVETPGTPGYEVAKAYRKLQTKAEGMRLDDETRALFERAEAKRNTLAPLSGEERKHQRRPLLEVQAQCVQDYLQWCKSREQLVRP